MMNRIAWFHFSFEVPEDWEPSAYSVEPRAGRIEFSNRHGYQALVSWEPCNRKPNLPIAMISFLRSKMPGGRTEDLRTEDDISILEIGEFLLGWHDGLPAQAVGYIADDRVLIRWIFEQKESEASIKAWSKVVTSFQPNTGPLRRYSLFGLDFTLPSQFVLEDMNCLPANVMMAFESRTKLRATFRRWGLTDVVLQGKSLSSFYTDFLHHEGCRDLSPGEITIAGNPAVKTSFTQRGTHKMERFMGRWWTEGEATVWHDVDEKRIYSFEQIGPKKAPRLTIEDVFPHLMQPVMPPADTHKSDGSTWQNRV